MSEPTPVTSTDMERASTAPIKVATKRRLKRLGEINIPKLKVKPEKPYKPNPHLGAT